MPRTSRMIIDGEKAVYHFHLLVKMIPEHRFTDEEIQQRVEAFYGKSRAFSKGQIPYFRQKSYALF